MAQIRDLGWRGSIGGGCCEEEMTTGWSCFLKCVGRDRGPHRPEFRLQISSYPALSLEAGLTCPSSGWPTETAVGTPDLFVPITQGLQGPGTYPMTLVS